MSCNAFGLTTCRAHLAVARTSGPVWNCVCSLDSSPFAEASAHLFAKLHCLAALAVLAATCLRSRLGLCQLVHLHRHTSWWSRRQHLVFSPRICHVPCLQPASPHQSTVRCIRADLLCTPAPNLDGLDITYKGFRTERAT
jgi:hypothetical protein